MPTARVNTHKIVTNHVVKATVDAATAITAWAKQTDQGNVPWSAPDSLIKGFPERRFFRAIDTSEKTHGFYRGQWGFIWTNDMLGYFLTNYLSGVESKAATILDYDDTDTAIYIQCTIYRPRQSKGTLVPLSSNGQAAPGMWQVTIEWDGGTDVS